jgi:hypothetical protein
MASNKSTATLIGVAVSISVLVAAAQPARPKAPTVTQGADILGAVRFPRPWTGSTRAATRELRTPTGFQARRLSDGSQSLLLISAHSDEFESDVRFVLVDKRTFDARVATDQEWAAARPLKPNPYHHPGSRWSRWPDGSGTAGVADLVSPTDMAMAVLSVTELDGPSTRGEMHPLLPKTPPVGYIYLDILLPSPARRIAAALAPYSGVQPGSFLSAATWLDERTFITPVELSAQTCFLVMLGDPK